MIIIASIMRIYAIKSYKCNISNKLYSSYKSLWNHSKEFHKNKNNNNNKKIIIIKK